ncbi:MAG TPA: peptidylprolyl isomerase [Steroidobacteraceae bacterium]|nr:peptidylprolyl isomerase [Steroidobacteraceae bacterium]
MATLTVVSGGMFGRAYAADPPAAKSLGTPQLRVTTSLGSFVIELYPDRAPITVAEFLKYVKDGQYTQNLFHRVVPGFLIQGGGFSATDESSKPVHGVVLNESGNGLQNKRGWVGLARTEAPHSGNCQFYINLADNPELDPLPVRWGYAVFGKVIDGMDVVDKIGIVPTGAEGRFKSDAPLTHVVIEKIELLGVGVDATPQDAPKTLAPAPTGNEVLSPN